MIRAAATAVSRLVLRVFYRRLEASGLERIPAGTHRYCMEPHEPIGLQRLEARPIATFSIEAQERHERMERTHRED